MRTRKRFNRFVKKLAELHGMEYYAVEKVYYNQGCNIENTRLILNMKNAC